MATRITLPSFSLPDARATADRVATWRPAFPDDRRLAAWQTATAPWWLWSDMPKLPLPARNPALPSGGLAGEWVVGGIDGIATRIWIQRAMAIIVRGLWLTVLVGCFWLILDLLGGPALEINVLVGIGIALMACSLIVAALSRPSRAQTARMLDRSFVLQERVSTALGNIGVDVPAEGEHAEIVYLQVADAANAITVARAHSAFRLRPPARELVMCVALGLAFAALAFARGAGGSVPDAQMNVVPEFVPAAQQFVQPKPEPVPQNPQNVPTVEDVQKMVQASIDNQQDLSMLSDALSDHAVTRDAAQLIDQGQYSDAAEALRDVSSQADQLSESERQDLANDLNQAASQMSEGNKTLSGATQQAAEGLEQGGDQAKEGVRDLANAVEQSGQQVQSSEALDQAMQQAQQAAAENPQQSPEDAENQGQPSPSQDGNSSAEQQSSEAAGQSGEPGKADANGGSGADSNAGQDQQQAGSQPGEGAQANGESANSSDQQNGQSQGQEGQEGQGSGNAPNQSDQNASGQSDDASIGAGAGGQSGDQDQQHNTGDASASGAPPAESETTKDPSNSNVSDSEKAGDDTTGPNDDPHAAVTLERAPQGQSVQTGSDSNSSMVGPGAGVTVGSGAATQGEVGEAGPDSNHVPPEYRSIVESYFSDKDGDG
jgi:hypothetical protein